MQIRLIAALLTFAGFFANSSAQSTTAHCVVVGGVVDCQEIAPSSFADGFNQSRDALRAKSAAVSTSSGMVYLSLREGGGASPTAADTVTVHYRGAFVDGREFDSSYKRNTPARFPLNGVIPCWTEGIQRMRVGGKSLLTCPPTIAYGERGAGDVVPPNATLRFEVELLEIAKR